MAIQWGFTESRPTDARYGDDVAKYAMSEGEDLKTFVREVLQNANDARLDDNIPVEVEFEITRLTGADFEGYKEAIDLEGWLDHAKMATDTESGEQIARFAEEALEANELRVLNINDRNTQGLLGAEDADESNFTALVRDVLFSSKEGETAGGSYGLGKAVLWLFSGMSMVLFYSVLSEDEPEHESPRLIARTRLPTHKGNGEDTIYQGHGWFGRVHGDHSGGRPLSIWGENAASLAERLRIDTRDLEQSGTNIQVVGFRDPTAEEQREDHKLAREIIHHTVESFWPAIYRGNLEVSVSTPDETYNADPATDDEIRPFVECLDKRRNAGDELEDPGDIVDEAVEIALPDKRSGGATEDGCLNLCVRLAEGNDSDRVNRVAFVRGAGMVVEYYDRDKVVVGGRDFHGVLLGGKARNWGLDDREIEDSDDDIEEFLLAAEPPQHNAWRRTEALKNRYKRGFRSAVEGIKSKVTDTLRAIVAPQIDRGSQGPQLLASRFPIGNEGRRRNPRGSQHVTGESRMDFDDEHDHWVFSGNIETVDPAAELTEVTISLARMAEERQTNDRIPVAQISSPTAGVTVSVPEEDGVKVGRLDIPAGIPSVKFRGSSERDSLQVRTRVNIRAELQREVD